MCIRDRVCALSRLDVYQKITVDLKMDELDVTAVENKATYEEIRELSLIHILQCAAREIRGEEPRDAGLEQMIRSCFVL